MSTGSPSGARKIGPIGTAARVAGGLAAVVVPVALGGITWWDVGAALFALPLIAAVTAAATSAALPALTAVGQARGGAAEPWIRSSFVLIVVITVATAATFVTPLNGSVAPLVFIGVSLLIAALRGDAGCEVVAIPNAIAGRTDPTGCVIYSPLDAIEARRSRGLPSPVPGQEVHR